MVTHLDTPADRLYEKGVPMDANDIIQHADTDITSPVKARIDWTDGVEMDDDTRFAVMSAVSHYHYVKTSNVLLCDTLLSRTDLPEPMRRIARTLLERNGEELQAWSKYVEEGGGCGPMGEEQKEYFQVIWEQDGVLPVLLGVQHINLAADTSYNQFQPDEPVFQQMSTAMREHNSNVYPAVNEAFREIFDGKGRRERLQILKQVAQQIDLLQLIARNRSNRKVFSILDTSNTRLVYGTGCRIKTFYGNIGLTDGLLPDLSR